MTEPVIKDPAEQRATRWLAEVDVLRARVTELERERDEARKTAQLLEYERNAARAHHQDVVRAAEVACEQRDAARRELAEVRGWLRWRRDEVPDPDDQYLVKRAPRYAVILPYSISHGSNVLREDEWVPLGDILAAIEPGGK